MRRVAARDTVEFDFLPIRQNVGDCEWLDSDFWLRNQGGKI